MDVNANRLSFSIFSMNAMHCFSTSPSIPIKEKNRLSLVVYLSLVTGEFMAYRNIEYGSDIDSSSEAVAVIFFLFTIYL